MSTASTPHLTTASTGALHPVERHLIEHQAAIESWFRGQWRETPAPFYASVDLRNAGYKLAPVDTNLFPAGFNNLNPEFEPLCVQALQAKMESLSKPIDRILIIPENHTRNRFYLENLATLQEIIEKAGFEVRLGSIIPDLDKPMNIELGSRRSVCLEPLLRDGDKVHLKEGFVPELLVLNNDLSSGRPDMLESLEQIIIPDLDLGWSNRLKSIHFKYYQEVSKEFSEHINIDPWLIEPRFRNCGEIDFMQHEGNACLKQNVATLLQEIQAKYHEYEIASRPYLIVKADKGTYGMGIMIVHSMDDIAQLNRKQRKRMATIKEGQNVSQVIIQEGVYTQETWGAERMVAEPVVYMIGHNVVGGFYRVHRAREANENLNAPGMHFEPLAFEECCISPQKPGNEETHSNRFYAYGVVARLALLAAARETES